MWGEKLMLKVYIPTYFSAAFIRDFFYLSVWTVERVLYFYSRKGEHILPRHTSWNLPLSHLETLNSILHIHCTCFTYFRRSKFFINLNISSVYFVHTFWHSYRPGSPQLDFLKPLQNKMQMISNLHLSKNISDLWSNT